MYLDDVDIDCSFVNSIDETKRLHSAGVFLSPSVTSLSDVHSLGVEASVSSSV